MRDLAPVEVPAGPTGPVDVGERQPRKAASDTRAAISAQWRSVVDVLDAVEAPSSALLCTSSGFPLEAYGYAQADLVPAARVAGRTFALRRATSAPSADGVTVEVVVGTTLTVMAAIPSAHGDHLLSVTADGVSMPVLRAWTSHVASQLGRVLAQA